MGLFQRQVAEGIGVSEATIYNWEGNESLPSDRYMPRIIQFLGYDPVPAPKTLSEKLRHCRQLLGLTLKAMAKRLGVDPTSLRKWERGGRRPSRNLLGPIEGFLNSFNKLRFD